MPDQKPRRGLGPWAEGSEPEPEGPVRDEPAGAKEEVPSERKSAVPGIGGSSDPPEIYGESGTRPPERALAHEQRLPEVGRAPIPRREIADREGEE